AGSAGHHQRAADTPHPSPQGPRWRSVRHVRWRDDFCGRFLWSRRAEPEPIHYRPGARMVHLHRGARPHHEVRGDLTWPLEAMPFAEPASVPARWVSRTTATTLTASPSRTGTGSATRLFVISL